MTNRLPERRTALITAAGIAAVIVAGAFAVGANLGILDASSDGQIGTLTAAGDLVPTTVPAAPAAPAAATQQTYVVDEAGTVAVDVTGGALRIGAVVPTAGWTWQAGPSDASRAELTFSDGVRVVVFSATRNTDGTIAVDVADVTSATASVSTATTAPSAHDDDDGDDGEAHDGEDDDEHEGRDDDD